MGVESSRDQHPGGRERLDHGRDDLVEGGQRHVAGGAGGSGKFTVSPDVLDTAGLVGPAGAGVRGELVGRHEQHARVVPEHVLRAVAVVDVPVDDEHPLAARRERGRRRSRRC